ncbi:MAG: DUF1552 domain-containing protein [Solimonas sp.]
MIIPRKRLDRRTVLKGVGAAVGLPLLEAMLPTASAADTAARPRRLQTLYSPNGMIMQKFRPATAGADYALPPTLEPLAPFKDRFTVVTGLAQRMALAGAGHGPSCPAFLTGVKVRPTEGSDLQCAVSMDQLVANRHASETPLPSLELGIDPPSLLGSCDIGYSCTYTNTLSWRSATVALPVSVNPRDVFELLFGDGDTLDEASRLAQLRRKTSVLDFVREDAARLSGRLGANDRQKMDQYLQSVRDIEQRIQKIARQDIGAQAQNLTRPAGIPDAFADHVRMMIDLQILAMQADLTRVGTFMIGRELSNRSYPEIGVADAHHMLSHHGGDPVKMDKGSRINRLHYQHFAYCLERLANTPDGEGSLLDSTLVLIGAAFGDSNTHDKLDLPIVVAGAGVSGNRHVVVPSLTPMANLLLAMLHRFDVPLESFGDSTGALSGVFA